jgi:CheY-like chemotaxis protein
MNTLPRQSASQGRERRILVIDDNASIREDFKKILCPAPIRSELGPLEDALFGARAAKTKDPERGYDFHVDTASQGAEGLEAVKLAMRRNTPYALAFVDMRMPPGWDGVETCERLWGADPDLQIVICSAYSDYSWHDVVSRLKRPDLRLLQKPFSSSDVLNLAWLLTSKRPRSAPAAR